jgi:hypothetical protein
MKTLSLLCLLALPAFAQPYAQCTLQSCDKTTVRKSVSRALAGDAGVQIIVLPDGGVGPMPTVGGAYNFRWIYSGGYAYFCNALPTEDDTTILNTRNCMYAGNGNEVGIRVGGVIAWLSANSNLQTQNAKFQSGGGGTITAPDFTFSGATGLGMYNAGASTLGFTTGSAGKGLLVSTPIASGVLLQGAGSNAIIRLDGTNGVQLDYASTANISVASATIGLNSGTGSVTTNNTNDLSHIVTRGIQLNTAGTVQPACAAGVRGLVWYTLSAAGTADRMEICGKSAANTYAWRAMAAFP